MPIFFRSIAFKRYCILSIIGLSIFLFLSLQVTANNSVARDENINIYRATLSDRSRSLSPDFFGTNNNALRVKSWQKPELVAAIEKLNPQTIRFPGGTVSNYWDWRYGGLIDDFRAGEADFFYSFSAKDAQYNSGQLENFAKGLELTKTKPIFVLNLATSNLESQLEMLRSAKKLGMPIEYVELGNELYINIPDNKDVFPQPEDYAKVATIWSDAIRQEFPEAKIALVGVVPTSRKPKRIRDWHQSFLPEAFAKADAITLHIYSGHGLKPTLRNTTTYPFFKAEDVKTILAQPFKKWQEVKAAPQFELIPSDRAIWITEYNLFENIFFQNQGRKPRVMGSWTHGLYAATMSLLFLEEPRVELICNHQLISGFYFASILPQASSFKDPSTQKSLATPYSLSAAGSALSLYGDAIAGMTEATQIKFEDNAIAKVGLGLEYPTLYGWMFANRERQNSLILNLSDTAREIDLSSLFPDKAYYQTMFGSPRDLVVNVNVLENQKGEVKGKLVLPPYAIAKISNLPQEERANN